MNKYNRIAQNLCALADLRNECGIEFSRIHTLVGIIFGTGNPNFPNYEPQPAIRAIGPGSKEYSATLGFAAQDLFDNSVRFGFRNPKFNHRAGISLFMMAL